MDRNLPENHSFRLNEDSASNNDGKWLIFVKLTDSCMRTIENVIKSNKKALTSNKANIKFHLHGGEISIPTTNNERKTYSFQICPEAKTPEVFQCIRQINRNQLESCGLIEQRMNIQAQEDVYSMTKTKVTEFHKHEELNKKQTKEIGESSKTILEKKTKKSSNSRSSTSQVSSSTKDKPLPSATNASSSSSSVPLLPPPPSSSSSAAAASTGDDFRSPRLSNIPGVSERSLRERLIHLLAVRKYRKPDLLVQLKRDGELRDDEKEQIDALLSSITAPTKSGELILLKNLLLSSQVNPDWPFFSKTDSTIVKRKIKDLQSTSNTRHSMTKANEPPLSSATNSSRSSLPSLPSKPAVSAATSSTAASTSAVPPPTKASTTNAWSGNALVRPRHVEDRNVSEKEERRSLDETSLSDERMQQLSEMLDKLSNAVHQAEGINEQTTTTTTTGERKSEEDLDEAEREYQRLVPEYNQLVDYVQTVSLKFSQLQEDFQDDQSEDKATKIVEEFRHCDNTDGYLSKRQRLLELHSKLKELEKLFEGHSTSPDWKNFDVSEDED